MTDESVADDDEDMTILRTTSLTKTNIEFDFRENDYDTARLRKSR